MEKKIQRAIKNLQKSTKVNPLSKFSFEDLQSGNSFQAKVFFNNNHIPEIEISQHTGYQIEELVFQLESSLNTLLHSALPDAKRGSKVFTRKAANVGDIVTLDSETNYYAIDSSIFDCTGKMLYSQFRAECISNNYSAKCSPTSEIAKYTVYKLF